MTLECSASFGTKKEMDRFVSRLNTLGFTPKVDKSVLSIVYHGYDKRMYYGLIEMFEDVKFHDIRDCTM